MLSKRLTEWLTNMNRNAEDSLPTDLVVKSAHAEWIGEEITGNPSRIGVLMDIPSTSMEFYLQEIPVGGSSDLQRHLHESVHYVLEGEGYSEIGPQRVVWESGDFVYTPTWVWHRHYNTGGTTVRMIIIENSKLIERVTLNRRESAGLREYAQLMEEKQ